MDTSHHRTNIEPMLRQGLRAGRSLRVGIVGAGVAGLRAADVLLQHGAHVTILEARGRFGGRLAQSELRGHLVDLGPNWIHGTNNNPILGLARETKSVLHSWGEHQIMVDDSGSILNEIEASELQETFWEVIVEAFRFSEERCSEISPTESLMDFVRREARSKFVKEPAESAHRKRNMLIQTAEMWGAFVGSPVDRQSLKFFWLEQCIEGENLFVAGTYARILAKIADPALKAATLRYGQDVKAIATKADGVEVVIDGHEPEVFDEVIVTVPLGCLKAGEPEFSPALPARLQKAINSIGYGCLDKVYITFPSAFWQLTGSSDVAVTNRELENGGSRAVKEQTNDSGNQSEPGAISWLVPKYAPRTNPHQWSQEGFNLAALPASTAHATILFYTFGACSQHVANLVAATPADKLDEALFAFFQPYYSRLPHYSEGHPDCQPTGALATAWANDKYSGHGSYSNFQVGLEEGDKDIECMREGMPERHVWFAGEHTAPFVALGTVTGAYGAGEGVAKRIVKNWETKSGL